MSLLGHNREIGVAVRGGRWHCWNDKYICKTESRKQTFILNNIDLDLIIFIVGGHYLCA